jgi:hypothetical protein
MTITRATSPLLAVVLLAGMVQGQTSKPNPNPTLGDALLGGVQRAKVVRTLPDGPFGQRGALQRTMFLDVLGSNRNLQIAFVLDATDSMGRDISTATAAIGQFADALRKLKHRNSDITLALVVYRDALAPSGSVVAPVRRFTANAEDFAAALGQVKTETGAPYFEEQVDLGLHAAIHQLPWADANDPEYSRWIILCGDAPPYRDGHALRQHGTDALVEAARARNIQIYSILCKSGFVAQQQQNPRLMATAQKLHPQFLAFGSRLAAETGGDVLDLWDRELVGRLNEAAGGATRTYQRLAPVSDEEIQSAQAATRESGRPVRIAVLPHVQLSTTVLGPDAPQTQVATELRMRLSRLPKLQTSDAVSVLQAMEELRKAPGTDEERLAALGRRLDVDFIIWGDYAADGEQGHQMASRVYRCQPDRVVMFASTRGDAGGPSVVELPGKVLHDLLRTTAEKLKSAAADERGWVAVFSAAEDQEQAGPVVVSKDLRAKRQILAGLELVERSLGALAGSAGDESDAVAARLEEAAERLDSALSYEANNPFAQLLLANCYHNLARYRDEEKNRARFEEMLRAAYENRDRAPHPSIRTEIEGDYALLVERDFAKAIECYGALARGSDEGSARFALRAHWMLAGIYLGDWGVNEYEANLAGEELRDKGIVDLEKGRYHILEILANWDGTPEAKFYRHHLLGETAQDEPSDDPDRKPVTRRRSQQFVELPIGQQQLLAY